MPRVVLFNKGAQHHTEVPMNGRDHFEYVMHDGKLFVKLPPCDQHDEQGRIHAYVSNPFTTV